MTHALPVRHYLTEISGEPQRRGGELSRLGRDGASEAEARIEEAYARGALEARAAAEAEHAAALAAREAAFQETLAAERQRWATEEGARLGQAIAAAMQEIETRISEQVGRVLRPVLADEVRNGAVAALVRALGAMLAKGDYAKITVSGPRDLLAAMEARLGRAQGLSFAEAEGPDLTVSADETVLETRIGAWARILEGDGGDADAAPQPRAEGETP